MVKVEVTVEPEHGPPTPVPVIVFAAQQLNEPPAKMYWTKHPVGFWLNCSCHSAPAWSVMVLPFESVDIGP